MICSACGRARDASDSFCRYCGAALALEVPVVRRSEPLPLPWEQARPAVARGLAALAAGLALELLLRGVARGVRNLPAVTRLDRGEARSTQDVEERVEVWSQTTFVRRVRRLRSGGAR